MLGLKFLNFHASKTNFIIMILDKDPAFGSHSKIFNFCILTFCHKCVEITTSPLVFYHLETIEPMFNCPIGVGNDSTTVPFSNGNPVSSVGIGVKSCSRRYQVIQRCHGPVSSYAHFGIRMFCIIEDLELRANACFFVFAGNNKVFYSRIGSIS